MHVSTEQAPSENSGAHDDEHGLLSNLPVGKSGRGKPTRLDGASRTNKSDPITRALTTTAIVCVVLAFVMAGAAQILLILSGPDVPSGFIRANGVQFTLDGVPWRSVGINMWQAMNLAAVSVDQLRAELDTLSQHGVTSVRIMAASEGPSDAPLQIVPTIHPEPGVFDEKMGHALDIVLAELSSRNMRAILVLNNQWCWSGGFAMYLAWARGGTWRDIPYPTEDMPSYWTSRPESERPAVQNASWDTFQRWVAGFYTEPRAVALAHALVGWLLSRQNTVNGVAYSDDRTIMAWELANEPRAVADDDEREQTQQAYLAWVKGTASLVKRLAPYQMVSVGSEGATPYEAYVNTDFEATHQIVEIDFITIHVWPENWGWGDAAAPMSFETALAKSLKYVEEHAARARAIGKPLVIEEFGLARDGQSHDPEANTQRRDAFYMAMLKKGADIDAAGMLPWAWSGSARPRVPGSWWQPGDALLGDPPHERQGWYSIFATDLSTVSVLQAANIAPPPTPPPTPPFTPPTSPPVCASFEVDDSEHEMCEDWCTECAHVNRYCKCRACKNMCSPPQPPPPMPPSPRPSPPACASNDPNDMAFEACEPWCTECEHWKLCKCRACRKSKLCLPPPPQPRPPPPLPPRCHSEIVDDSSFATCEPWCSECVHWQQCKCRACPHAQLCKPPPPPTAAALAAAKIPPPPPPGAGPACHTRLPGDAPFQACEGWCKELTDCRYCKCRACKQLSCDAKAIAAAWKASISPPPPPGAGPACHSKAPGDTPYEACQSWCSQPEHCDLCKCRACYKLGAGMHARKCH